MKLLNIVSVALLSCVFSGANAAIVTANAAADFSTTQGENGWNYGYFRTSSEANKSYEANDFKLFNYEHNIQGYSVNGWSNGSFAQITPLVGYDSLHMHPSNQDWTILRYNIATSGLLNLDFTFGRLNTNLNASVNARVYLNGKNMASQQNIFFGQTFQSTLLSSVHAGDKLDFVIDANGDQGSDSSTLKANLNIAPVPEPETYALMGMGLLGLLATRRRKAVS